MQDHNDFEFEHSPGIPAPLPPGEHVLWQGSPDLWEIAKSAFHIRKIAIYFALILAIQTLSTFQTSGQTQGISLPLTAVLIVLGMTIVGLLAYATSRVTIYTLTNKRILIRFGIALQMTINLPFSQISSADMRVGKNGFGDIPLATKDHKRISYLVLWPHVRPWNFSRPQPMLRSIANVESVAQMIGEIAASSPAVTRNLSNAKEAPSKLSGAPADAAVLMQSEVS